MSAIKTHDHELKIGSETKRLNLIREDSGRAMYQVIEEVPNYQSQLRFIQTDWIGGHGQYDLEQLDCYFEGQSIDTTCPGKIILGPKITEVQESDDTDLDSAPVIFRWFNATSEWLCATSGKIYRYNVGGNAKWTAATTTVAGVTNLREFADIMYAAVGTPTKYYYSTDGITWTQTNLDDGYAEKFRVAPNPAGTADVLWKYKTPNQVCSTTDGRTVVAGGVQWSSPAYIGDISNNITNIFLINDRLIIGKEDNMFHYDSDGGLHPLREDLRWNRSTDNFKYVTDWQTCTYFSEIDGMGEITQILGYQPMGPLTNIDDIDKRGDVVGLTSDKDWIYVAMDEGTNTHIYKGREVGSSKGLRWEWCPFVFLGTNACATIGICQHSASDKRLWFGYGSSTAYVILSDNPTADTSYRFASDGWLRMSYTSGGNKYWDKLFQSLVTQTEDCAAGISVTPYYRKDTDASATSLTAAITTNGTVNTNFTAQQSCKRIQFQLNLATNDSTKTPQVTYFEARGTEKPEVVRIHECTYAIGDTPSRRAETYRTLMRTARTSTSLIKFADLRYGQDVSGTDYVWVVMQPGYPKEIEVLHEKGKAPEIGIQVRWQEVSFTIS